jgi:RNA-directed DNA polymerase
VHVGRYGGAEGRRGKAGRAAGSRSAPIGPVNLGNVAERTQGRKEGRRNTELSAGKAQDMSKSDSVSTKQRRIAQLAREAPDMAMNLSHHMDLEWFEEAYRRTRKDGATGIDEQTAQEFAEDLQENLQRLIDLAKSGTYRAPAVRRVHIPKGSGKETRPIGIPTFADKVLQRAAMMALEPVYEQDFLDCSYGFRRGRSQHNALHALREGLMAMDGGYVIDLDVRRYFDEVDHRLIQQIFRQRIRDGVLRRLIGKWLNAGVMEEGRVSYPGEGVPQGGVISPMLSNVYLHEVLDLWFEEQVKPRMRGRAFMIRFADDALLVFEHKHDAERVMRVLPERLAKYGLRLHPEKTRLVQFKRPRLRWEEPGDGGHGGSLGFLGFTHFWCRTRGGGWAVRKRTSKDRLSRSLRQLNQWLRLVRHWPIAKQHEVLCQKIRGHMQYYGVPWNIGALDRYLFVARYLWRKWLARRSHHAKHTWTWFWELLKRFPLPRARISVRPGPPRSEAVF